MIERTRKGTCFAVMWKGNVDDVFQNQEKRMDLAPSDGKCPHYDRMDFGCHHPKRGNDQCLFRGHGDCLVKDTISSKKKNVLMKRYVTGSIAMT